MQRSGPLLLLVLIATASVIMALPPIWWSTPETQILDPVNPATTTDNYSPANLGQLKHVAKMAKKHLDQHLPGGSGTAITDMVAGFEPRDGQNYTQQQIDDFRAANYAPVNLGQLKAVAKPFYERLKTFSYSLTDPPSGRDSSTEFPWTSSTADDTNYSPANLGQLKFVFSFDLSAPEGQLPEWWQKYYFNGQTGIDPGGDFDDDKLSNLQEFLEGTNPTDPDSNDDGIGDGSVRESFDYDLLGRMESVIDNRNSAQSYDYDDSGNIESAMSH